MHQSMVINFMEDIFGDIHFIIFLKIKLNITKLNKEFEFKI